jgi:tetratricopeptide (TPR) repeat protein
MRDPETGRLRVLLATEIDRSLNPTAQLSIAYALIDARGNVVSSRIESDVKGTIRPATRTQQFIGAAMAEAPGVHTVKVAVIDSTGKQGSVEHTFRAQLTAAGQIRATDLLIAENVGAAGGVLPAVTGEFTTDMLHGYIELYSDAPEPLSQARVTIEVAEDERSRTLEGAAARLQPATGEGPNRVTAEAALPIALLPPGEYVARAVISIDDTPAATVVRPFKIARSAAATSAAGSRPGSAVRPPIPFTSRIDAFDRRTVLTPQVVGFFLDRMNVGARGESPAAPAMDLAREGRFDAALDALKQPAEGNLAATFIHGLALYARGDLEAAAVKFRESVRIDPEFFPAAFYLGSCYAAGGRDREAANAWQTSLVTESDAPFIYTLLGDALLRLRDVERALDILKEASSLWPDNEQVQLRLGTALSLNGQQAEALRILEGYLEKHPEDAERQFVALRTIYEAAAAGTPIKSAAEDRALFEKYAAAYAAANGPQLAMVEQWKKFLDKR